MTPEGVDGPDGAGSQKGLQHCESLLDRIEVGAIGRKESEPSVLGANSLLSGCAFMGRQIVQTTMSPDLRVGASCSSRRKFR